MKTKSSETIVEPCEDDSGNWYWAVKTDGEVFADGKAENRLIAQSQCHSCYEELQDIMSQESSCDCLDGDCQTCFPK